MGQWNLFLLLLVTGAWAADRTGRPGLAGSLLGVATAIKLFPGLFLVYFALRRRWSLVTSGIITLSALTGATAAVLGVDSYRVYCGEVLPEIQWFRVGWSNPSLVGFWSRLFDPVPGMIRDRSRSDPLLYSPAVARIGSVVCAAALGAILTRAARRARPGMEHDLAFGLVATAMILLSPIAWEHYLLLLLVPLAVTWLNLPEVRWARISFGTIVAAIWISPPLLWQAFDLAGSIARPVDNLTVIPYQCYALLGLVALDVFCLNREGIRLASSSRFQGDWAEGSHSGGLDRFGCSTIRGQSGREPRKVRP
jgi:hypothetical protein